MYVRTLLSVGASLLACTVATAALGAEEGNPGATTVKEKKWFMGLSGGGAYAVINHPLIKTNGFAAGALGMHAGYTVAERWTLGLEVLTVEHGMKRQNAFDPFTPTSLIRPQAGCNNCEPPPKGGWVTETTAMFGTVGPRAEFSPFGRDGLYLGASAGLGMMLGVDTQYGFGGGARAGYRYRIANVLGLAIEGGVNGQYFSAGTSVFPYAALILRPYF